MRMGYWALLALALCLTMGAKQADNGYWADRFDVPAEVVPGGDLRAIEQEAAKRFALAAAEQGGPGSSAEEPKTARQAERAKSELDDQDWLFIATGGLALAICSGLVYTILRRARRTSYEIPGFAFEPPDELAPAMAGALRALRGKRANAARKMALATLLDLAGRGHFAIDQLPKGRWRSSDFLIHQLKGDEMLRPHEVALMALLLEDENGYKQTSVRLSHLRKLAGSKRWKRFQKSMEAELIAAGLMSESRAKVRGRATALSGAILLLLCNPKTVCVLSEAFGWLPFATAGALLLLGLLGMVAAEAMSTLSDEGEQMAAAWEPFYRYLLAVSQGKAAPATEDEFERFLPYAMAYGLLYSWASRFDKLGWTETPAYFRPLRDEGQRPMATFVAMTLCASP